MIHNENASIPCGESYQIFVTPLILINYLIQSIAIIILYSKFTEVLDFEESF